MTAEPGHLVLDPRDVQGHGHGDGDGDGDAHGHGLPAHRPAGDAVPPRARSRALPARATPSRRP